MSEDTALTPLEVSEMLKISKNTVYELIKRGELTGYKVGKKIRVDMSELEVYRSRKKDSASKIFEEASSKLILDKKEFFPHEDLSSSQDFVICGQDILLDILSQYLERLPYRVHALRSYVGSYNGLYSLYHGKVQIATAHLWDGETEIYNTPYVKRLLPGVPAILVRLCSRMQGFYVYKGNPKNITGWEDLRRTDISIICREKGSGTRILLDERLKKLGIKSTCLRGYERECTSHMAVASAVARGDADFALGNEKNSLQVREIDFIPLQKESYDLVMKAEDLYKAPYQALLKIVNSDEFRDEIKGLGGYDISETGKFIAEI